MNRLPVVLDRSWCVLASAAALAFTLPSLAQAQQTVLSTTYFDRTNNVGVRDRSRPDYSALGINVGAFVVHPSLTIAPEYDDNIFASHSDQTSDLVTAIEPSVQIRSNWVRNEVDAYAQLVSDVYASHSGENTTDYQIGGSGRLDVFRASDVTASFSYSHSTESRTAEDADNAASSPVQYDQIVGSLGALQTLNRLRFSETFDVQRLSFQNTTTFNGAALDQGFRDDTEYDLLGRADYALDPEISVFVSGTVNTRVYDEKPPQTSIDRSSSGFQTTVGTDFDLTRLARGQFQVGYLSQHYVSGLFHPVSGPAAQARIEYFLSDLTTITFHLNRSVFDAQDPTAISVLQTATGLQVDQELLRNLILSAQLNYETDSFKGIDRTDDRFSTSLSGTYLLNRHLGLTAEYSFLGQTSSGSSKTTNYDVNVISLSLVFQL